MERTIRKDRNGKKYKESLKKKEARYKCRCEYCSRVSKNLTCEKIAKKELKTELKSDGNYYEGYGIIWDKQAEFCNDYCSTVRDFVNDYEEIVNKYVINYG